MHSFTWISVLFSVTFLSVTEATTEEACYGVNPCDYYSLNCQQDEIIRLGSLKYGLSKLSVCQDINNHCDYEDDCCISSSSDCSESFSLRHTYEAYKNCSGRQYCVGMQSPWKLMSCGAGFNTSTYVSLEYECETASTKMDFCGNAVLTGNKIEAIFNGSKEKFDPNKASRKCGCRITNNLDRQTVRLNVIDIRLESHVRNENNTAKCSSAHFWMFGYLDRYCYESQNHELNNFFMNEVHDVLLQANAAAEIFLDDLYVNGYDDSPAMVWIGVEAEPSKEVEMYCREIIPLTTTTTTSTTTMTTPAASTSVQSTSTAPMTTTQPATTTTSKTSETTSTMSSVMATSPTTTTTPKPSITTTSITTSVTAETSVKSSSTAQKTIFTTTSTTEALQATTTVPTSYVATPTTVTTVVTPTTSSTAITDTSTLSSLTTPGDTETTVTSTLLSTTSTTSTSTAQLVTTAPSTTLNRTLFTPTQTPKITKMMKTTPTTPKKTTTTTTTTTTTQTAITSSESPASTARFDGGDTKDEQMMKLFLAIFVPLAVSTLAIALFVTWLYLRTQRPKKHDLLLRDFKKFSPAENEIMAKYMQNRGVYGSHNYVVNGGRAIPGSRVVSISNANFNFNPFPVYHTPTENTVPMTFIQPEIDHERNSPIDITLEYLNIGSPQDSFSSGGSGNDSQGKQEDTTGSTSLDKDSSNNIPVSNIQIPELPYSNGVVIHVDNTRSEPPLKYTSADGIIRSGSPAVIVPEVDTDRKSSTGHSVRSGSPAAIVPEVDTDRNSSAKHSARSCSPTVIVPEDDTDRNSSTEHSVRSDSPAVIVPEADTDRNPDTAHVGPVDNAAVYTAL